MVSGNLYNLQSFHKVQLKIIKSQLLLNVKSSRDVTIGGEIKINFKNFKNHQKTMLRRKNAKH